ASIAGVLVNDTVLTKAIVNAAGGIIEGVTGIKVSAGTDQRFTASVSNAGVILSDQARHFTSASTCLARVVAAGFTDAVRNSGVIFGVATGVLVSSFAQFGSASAGGGIVNSGAIRTQGRVDAFGILVGGLDTFAGGITNAGIIAQAGSASDSNF